MKTIVLLAACGLAAMAGCQVSGEAEVDTTARPPANTGAAASTGYTMSYAATRDTEWRSGTEASAKTGTLRTGDRVMFNRAPDMTMEWQPARTADGRTVYVRPADFAASSR
jgi:hypothetical protein